MVVLCKVITHVLCKVVVAIFAGAPIFQSYYSLLSLTVLSHNGYRLEKHVDVF